MRAAPTYEEFAVRFEQAPGGEDLAVRLLYSPYGPCAPERFCQPFPDHQPFAILQGLEAVVSETGDLSAPARNLVAQHLDHHSSVSPEEVGRKLYDSLFTGSLRENFLRCLALTEGRETSGLRLRLVLEPAVVQTVGVWPWELLYRFETRDFLGRGKWTPIVRQIEVQRPALIPVPIERLRVLAVVANPTDADPLEVEREKEKIDTALGTDPAIDVEYLVPPTIEALWRRLSDKAFDVLHFVAHGEMGAEGHGHVQLEDEGGLSALVSGTLLADTVKAARSLRLVVLNACQTARLPPDANGQDPFLGVATALVMAGLPAVVAMQFAITDQAAIAFSEAFYRSLAIGEPVESAMVDGRMAISHAQFGSWEWATPVLFLGVPNGKLFTRTDAGERPDQASVTGQSRTPILKALDLLERLRYQSALDILTAARKNDPSDSMAAYYLALARLQGNRPRATRLDVVKRIEDELELAIDLAGAEPPAHVYYLQALIKHDFYRFKGLTIRPPTVEELLVEAKAAPANRAELERLLGHVPSPPSPVREAIERRLQGSDG